MSRPDPQIAHKLSLQLLARIVDNVWKTSLLLGRNSGFGPWLRLYARGFLPTMKLQLSQLP